MWELRHWCPGRKLNCRCPCGPGGSLTLMVAWQDEMASACGSCHGCILGLGAAVCALVCCGGSLIPPPLANLQAPAGGMLKMMTFFQGLPGQQTVPGVLDFPRSSQKLPSTSEGESETSMSEASSEDLVPPLEAKAARESDKDQLTKQKKRSKGLANMFSVFTKGRKKGQPSSAQPEGEPESRPESSRPLPTGRLGPRAG